MKFSTHLNGTAITQLQQVLEAAAAAPGNRKRFFEAGLIETYAQKGKVQLLPDWQSAFLKLRPIAKDDIRKHPGQFLATADDITYRGNTSGTQGQHFTYFAGSEWNLARLQARQRSLSWWGIDEQMPILNLASRLLPVRLVDQAIAGAPTPEFLDRLLKLLAERPTVIRGYPSRLCQVAVQLVNEPVPPVVAVISTGECLFEFQKSLLDKVFAAPIINEYGCQESGISGMTCPEAGRLHLDSDRCLYEVIEGQLVTTDLLNHVMPMVRYLSGDVAELSQEPCPCGRPGPTAILLGRLDDRIRTIHGVKYPGEVAMPAFEGILSYQLLRGPASQIALRVQPEMGGAYLSLESLLEWTGALFGEMSAELLLDESLEVEDATAPTVDDDTWIDSVIKGPWSGWLQAPLPQGEAHLVAHLLRDLVSPSVLRYSGLPITTQTLLKQVLDRPIAPNPRLEQLTARVLLYSCSLLDDPEVAISVYQQAAERLQACLGDGAGASLFPRGGIGSQIVDLLTPTLFFDTATAQAIWAQWSDRIDPEWIVRCPLDSFSVHHLMQAFESAAARSVITDPPLLQALRPLVAVLLGDLRCFASRFGIWLLAHWLELLQGQPVPDAQRFAPEQSDPFLTAWLTWRTQLLRQTPTASALPLLQAARRPEEQAQAYVEQGYGKLVMGQVFDPEEWLTIVRANIGFLSGEQPQRPADPTAWIPILKALAPRLLAIGKPDFAYQCLVMAVPPSSRISAFERLAGQVNNKQSVICDARQFTSGKTAL